jgi:hypothetical protein
MLPVHLKLNQFEERRAEIFRDYAPLICITQAGTTRTQGGNSGRHSTNSQFSVCCCLSGPEH